MKKRYSQTNQCSHIIRYYHDGTKRVVQDKQCCEVIKFDFHKVKTIELKIQGNKVFYSAEEIERWVTLLKTMSLFKFEYKILDGYHSIILNTVDYIEMWQLYLAMVVIRYLWYTENDGLIDRIFDIVDKSKLKPEQAIILAQCYGNTDRCNTFNICYQNTLPDNIEYHFQNEGGTLNFNPQINNLFLTHRVLAIERDVRLMKLESIWSRIQLTKIKKLITDGSSYDSVWNNLRNIQKTRQQIFSAFPNSSLLTTIKSVLNSCLDKKVKNITETDNFKQDSDYLILFMDNNHVGNKKYSGIWKYNGFLYPNRDEYQEFRSFKQGNNEQSFNINKVNNQLIGEIEYEN